MKKTNKNKLLGMCLGMCLGISFGCVFGKDIFGSMSIGMCLGLSLGMSVGMAIGAAKDNSINQQMDEKGYTIKSIVVNECGEYEITIIDKVKLEKMVKVSKKDFEVEKMVVGDNVFLNEDGKLELIDE